MSQEPPKSQPPLSRPGAGESETTVEQGLRLPENLKPSPVGFEGSGRPSGVRRVIETGSRTSGRWRLASRVFGQAPAGVECCGRTHSLLPENLNQKLSDTALTGVIAGLAMILVLDNLLLPGKPPEVANLPAGRAPPQA